tara:strand:- start:6826 stop:12963 length:6138 start_codon:yes stop_codon:yes gene_type:complete
MPEIKHTFQGGKMNKDLDERLVPNGQYRSAMNIQVRTTGGDDDGIGASGTVQNIKGNDVIGSSIGDELNHKCAATVVDEKNDVAYFLFYNNNSIQPNGIEQITGETIYTESIVEQHVDGQTTLVVVDVYAVVDTTTGVLGDNASPTGTWTQITVSDGSKYRVGMTIKAINIDGVDQLDSAKIKSINGNVITLHTEQTLIIDDNIVGFIFEHPKLLNLRPADNNLFKDKITGINVVDKFLFWTDNRTEPKKINIERCKAGTNINGVANDGKTHTKLMLENPTTKQLVEAGSLEFPNESDQSLLGINSDLLEEHITVIRKAPTTPPTIDTQERAQGDVNTTVEVNLQGAVTIGETITLSGFSGTKYRPDDILIFTEEDDADNIARYKFISYQSQVEDAYEFSLTPTDVISIELISTEGSIQEGNVGYDVNVDLVKGLFELKFPRFGYRYKYEDGEYSSFSPWSEIVFKPGNFDYTVVKAYNLGMVNTIKELVVKDFIPLHKERPLDVAAVDILFKTTDSPSVYVIKTINKETDPEWELFTPGPLTGTDSQQTGELNVTSEMIHRALPSNQILRAWDNVPKYALAQEITGSRLLYANYTQGYDVTFPVNLIQNLSSDNSASLSTPQKSIKSIRSYKWGMVFGDKYGRETPVISSGYTMGDGTSFESFTGDIVVEKQLAPLKNTFTLTQQWANEVTGNGEPMEWMDYVKYYIKETTNEYYNLVMDYWYRAEKENNLWLSFPSADRNKVDEETYLILKNHHGSQKPVTDKARYKIIAIENEAPDFIKIDHRIVGELQIDAFAFQDNLADNGNIFASNVTVTNTVLNTSDPQALMTRTDLEINSAEWLNFLNNYQIRGDLYVRVVGKTIDSTGNVIQTIRNENWKTVTRISNPTDENGEIGWDETFGEDANMFQQFTDAGYTLTDGSSQLTYFLEFKEQVVENKPEFDGRFFVLIEKDAILMSALTETSPDVDTLSPIATYNIGYVSSTQYNEAISGTYADSEGDFSDGFATNEEAKYMALGCYGFDNIPADFEGNPYGVEILNYGSETRDFWDGCSLSESDAIFIDSARCSRWDWDEAQPEMGVDSSNTTVIECNNFRPPGLSEGGATSGIGRINLSKRGDGIQSNELIDFLSQPGCIFQFPQDPTEKYYITVGEGIFSHAHDGGQTMPYSWSTSSGNPYGMNGAWDNLHIWSYGGNITAETNLLAAYGTNPGDLYTLVYPDYINPVLGPPSTLNTWDWPQNSGCGIFNVVDLTTYDVSSHTLSPSDFDALPGSYDPDVYAYHGVLIYGVGNSINIQEHCGIQESTDKQVYRESCTIEFREYDKDTGQTLSNGLNFEDFDPRGETPHDGSSASLQVSILTGVVEQGSSQELQNVTDGACWETEPKKDANLDIYYEASHAIPMTLSSDNTLGFVPINSKVGGIINKEDGSEVVVDLSENSTSDHHVSYIDHMGDIPVVNVSSTNAAGNIVDHTYKLPIGSFITFEHSDGTITRSRINNYVSREVSDSDGDGNNDTYIFNKQTWYSVNLVKNEGEDNSVTFTDNSGEDVWNTIISDNSDVSVVGGEAPGGIYLNNFSGLESNLWINDSSWMTDGVTYQVFVAKATGWYEIETDVWQYPIKLGWFNCYSFGNGVESDRIRDDFNSPMLDNGIKVSTTLRDYKEETRSSGLIYSGIYNSTSGVNDLNEFNMAEKITKDLNPSYGSIQALKTRDTDVVVFTEDKVLKVLSNKDALFNADGNPQLTATDRVLGTAVPFVGDYGISQNPESLAWDNFRMYFTDKQRGAVLRLSRDGLTPISNVGMKTYFRENLKSTQNIIGTFDVVNGEYNVTLNNIFQDKTVSFNEGSKGWVSFKSFHPNTGASISGSYLTTKDAYIYRHNIASITGDGGELVDNYNTFYGNYTESSINVLFNDMPGSVKSFQTINYEGSQARVTKHTNIDNETGLTTKDDAAGNTISNLSDGEYFNLVDKDGWYVESFTTDMQSGNVPEFKNKENKWFNKINGDTTNFDNLDTNEFSVQGIGSLTAVIQTTPGENEFTFTIQNLPDDDADDLDAT